MNWIFEHFQLVIVIASAFAWWINQRREAAEEDKNPGGQSNEEMAERARRKKIQDDIRRTIMERRGDNGPQQRTAPLPQPHPSEAPPPADIPPFLKELMGIPNPVPVEPSPPPVPELPPSNPIMDRHKQMEEELSVLEGRRREAESMAAKIRRSPLKKSRKSSGSGGVIEFDSRNWRTVLRNPRSVRRAVVLKEILDRPLALR